MQLIADQNTIYSLTRTSAYPAPLCEACNVPMRFIGEYGSISNKGGNSREYQCRMCCAGKVVRRTSRRD